MTTTFDCRECGAAEAANYVDPTRSRLIVERLCFSCDFWARYVGLRDDADTVRVDGVHFRIGSEAQTGAMCARGHGGRRFAIEFNDGRRVTSTNLWCQGVIPDRFRDRLPDNARFAAEVQS